MKKESDIPFTITTYKTEMQTHKNSITKAIVIHIKDEGQAMY